MLYIYTGYRQSERGEVILFGGVWVKKKVQKTHGVQTSHPGQVKQGSISRQMSISLEGGGVMKHHGDRIQPLTTESISTRRYLIVRETP